jgi:hypothetical protein
MTDQFSVQEPPRAGFGGTEIKTIKLWIKAFVPNTVDGGGLVPGTGEHAGKPMHLLLNRAFLTDERDFSSDIHASARMHSEIEIDLVRGKHVYEFHHCYETVEVDTKTGAEKCRKLGDTENMHFSDVEFFEDGLGCSFAVKASSKNPCISIATVKLMPNLDYEGTIRIALTADRKNANISFEGLVETYPAFEMYVSLNNGPAQAVFQVPIADGATASAMMGPPNRPLSQQVMLIMI